MPHPLRPLRVDHEYPAMGDDQLMHIYPIRAPANAAHEQHEVVKVNSHLQYEAQQAWNHEEVLPYNKDGELRWWAHTSYADKREPTSNMFKIKPERIRPEEPTALARVTSDQIPMEIVNLATYINSLPKNTKGASQQYPAYNRLRHDEKLNGEICKRDGRLSQASKLRKWNGDERLFSKDMWRYLTELD